MSAVVDLGQLLARDHEQLDRAIAFLMEPSTQVVDRRAALDAARVSFAAHADAEAAVLYAALDHVCEGKHDIAALVAEVLASHRVQESILRRMDASARTDDWMCATVRLRRTLHVHAGEEQTRLLRSLREQIPACEFQRLAGGYAAEKMRALSLLASVVTQRDAIRGPRRAAR
jgi:hypothetical protein